MDKRKQINEVSVEKNKKKQTNKQQAICDEQKLKCSSMRYCIVPYKKKQRVDAFSTDDK